MTHLKYIFVLQYFHCRSNLDKVQRKCPKCVVGRSIFKKTYRENVHIKDNNSLMTNNWYKIINAEHEFKKIRDTT